MNSNKEYMKKVNILGVVSMAFVLVCLFVPPLYVWIRYNLSPGWAGIMKIAASIIPVCIVGYIAQPASYYPALGAAGSYIGWSAGSVADIRMPAVAMAQEVTDIEPGTEKGNIIATLACSTSVFVSIGILTAFTVVGSVIMEILPAPVQSALSYVVASIFAAVVANMVSAKTGRNLVILVAMFVLQLGMKGIGLAAGWYPLASLIAGILITRVWFVAEQKKKAQKSGK